MMDSLALLKEEIFGPARHWRRPSKEVLAPIITRDECKTCDGRCCFLPEIYVALAEKERLQYARGKFPYEVEEIPTSVINGHLVLKKRADGSCPHFDWKTRKCLVYDKRPEACKRWYCGKGMNPGDAINNHGNAWDWSLAPAFEKWRTKMTKVQKELLIALNQLGRKTFHAVSVITTERGKCNGNSKVMDIQRKRYETITIKVVEELTRKGYADQINNGRLFYKISKKGQQAAAKLLK